MTGYRRLVRIVLLSTLLLHVLGAIPAYAAPVSVAITARVSEVGDTSGALGGSVAVGDIIEGVYTYDPATPPMASSTPILGMYLMDPPPSGIDLAVHGLRFRTDSSADFFAMEISNNHPTFADTYEVYSPRNLFDVAVPGATASDIVLSLTDHSQSVFANTALPSTPPDLSKFDDRRLFISSQNADMSQSFWIRAEVTDVRAKVEPLPTVSTPASSTWSLALLTIVGIAGVALAKRRPTA
jgi:hypothetical protein